MATTNYSWNLPTVGGSENTWGTQLNSNWTALDTLLNGVTQAEISLLKGQTSLVPSGVIVMWSGTTGNIPSGWYLCDGTNGTPDLTDRFVVGAGGSYGVGNTGGADSVTLTQSQIPGHTHTFSDTGTTSTDGAHTHTVPNGNSGGSSTVILNGNARSNDRNTSTSSAGSHNHTFSVSGTTSSTGGGSSHENRPPYYALAYIMKA